MNSILHYGLIVIAIFIVALIGYDIFMRWSRQSHKKSDSMPSTILKDIEHSIQSTINVDVLDDDAFPTLNKQTTPPVSQEKEPQKQPQVEDIILLSILAKSGRPFASYDLLQAITGIGMQFGDMDIFHYYEPREDGQERIFCLSSATKPGTFDLGRMGDFSCTGLCLFMDKKAVNEPRQAFLTMFEKAEQLADDLDGELCLGTTKKPVNEEQLEQYLKQFSLA